MTKATTRTLLSVATAAASLGVGVLLARALNPADESQSATSPTIEGPGAFTPTDDTISVEQALTSTADSDDPSELPLLAPVFVGDDPTILERLLAGPPAIDQDAAAGDQGEDSQIIGAVSGEFEFAQSDDGGEDGEGQAIQVRSLPGVFDSIGEQFVRFPLNAWDICAGRQAGVSTAVQRRFGSSGGCPVGFAGTLNGLRLWPAPFVRGELGHHLEPTGGITQTCPASTPAVTAGETALTVFSSIPMASVRADFRPQATSHEWASTIQTGFSADYGEEWAAQRATGIFTNAALLPHCLRILTDPDISYEVKVFGTDADGNTYEGALLYVTRSTERPPTQVVTIDGRELMASVLSYTSEGGSVRYTIRSMADDSDTACRVGGEAVTDVEYIYEPPGIAPYEDYPTIAFGWIPLQVGSNLLCATILDASGNSIGVDTLVIRTPTLQRPVITLAGVRLNDGVTIPGPESSAYDVGELWITGPFGHPCGGTWSNPTDLSGATGSEDLAVLWRCGSGPGTPEGGVIPVKTSRRTSLETATRIHRAIPVSTDVCDPGCPFRPTEWYEIPIAARSGSGADGVAIVRLEYESFAGAPGSSGSSTLITSTAPSVPTPVIRVVSTTVGSPDDWSAIPVTVRIQSDTEVTLVDVETATTGGEDCGVPSTFDSTRGTEFEIGFTVCASTVNWFSVFVTDDAGFEHRWDVGEISGIPSVVGTSVNTTVEFLGGAAPRFSLVERFDVNLDGQNAYLWGFQWSNAQETSPGSGCVSMDTTIIEPDTDVRITVDTGDLYLNNGFTLTNEGAPDCGPADGYQEAEAVFSLDQLQSGEPLVATTSADAWRQLRITVTGEWFLELDGVRF